MNSEITTREGSACPLQALAPVQEKKKGYSKKRNVNEQLNTKTNGLQLPKNNQLQQIKHQFGKTTINESNTDQLQTSSTVCNKSRKAKPKP